MTSVSVILRACNHFNNKWPKELTSGIMFYEGQRITIEEFTYYARMLS